MLPPNLELFMKAIRIETIPVEPQKPGGFLGSTPPPFRIFIDIGKSWELVQKVHESELLELRDKINEALGLNDLAKTFNISVAEAEEIKRFHKKEESTCKSCPQKMKGCRECVLLLQSPLERKLFLALKEASVEHKLQARIHKDGSIHDHTTVIDKETIRTIPDFLLTSKAGKTICVYADGHTYHERTEYQALRDRSIDRDVQQFGYTVLRFTGKEINSDIKNVVEQIKHIAAN